MKSTESEVNKPKRRPRRARRTPAGDALVGPIKPTMSEAEFWCLIAEAWAEARVPEEMVDLVIAELSRRSLGEIFGFGSALGHLTRLLNRKVGTTLKRISGVGRSEYVFLTDWIIAQGETFFRSTLVCPEQVFPNGDPEFETLPLTVASFVAFREKTGLRRLEDYFALH
jgi:hypothetical protein